MKVITCPVASAPVISVKEPKEVRHFEGIENALNYLVSSRGIEVYSEMSHLPAKEATNMKTWEVTELPETVSYQIARWFINVTSTGSIFHKNHNRTGNIGYLDENWVPMVTDRWAKILLAVTA